MVINDTRAGLRKSAAKTGWTLDTSSDPYTDLFTRGDRRAHIGYRSYGPMTGRFLAAFLIDVTDPFAGRSGDGIVDEGTVATARRWFSA